jgi:hypothetical protein
MPEAGLPQLSLRTRYILVVVSLVSGDAGRLSPLGTSATNRPNVPAPDYRWWVWSSSSQWNDDWQAKPKYSEKTCPSATLSTISPTWSDPDSNSGSRVGKSATNSLSCGTAFILVVKSYMFRKSYKILLGKQIHEIQRLEAGDGLNTWLLTSHSAVSSRLVGNPESRRITRDWRLVYGWRRRD